MPYIGILMTQAMLYVVVSRRRDLKKSVKFLLRFYRWHEFYHEFKTENFL